MKDLKWLKEEIKNNIQLKLDHRYGLMSGEYIGTHMLEVIIDQLDEPEVLSQEFINEKAVEVYADTADAEVHAVFRMRDLQNLLVPKQGEVDQAYKDGYEKGKQHATKKQSEETETVARVFVDYLIASAKLKLALSMEVEELEE